MSETISMSGVSAASLRLMGEDVLVRAMPAEEVRASGLWVPTQSSQSFGRGNEFYATVVACGPGRLVEKAPPAADVAGFVEEDIRCREESKAVALEVSANVYDFVTKHTTRVYVPLPWKPGDRVLCRQGFGPEIELREGRHHVIGRGNSEHGHGIIAAWDAEHVHCWHDNERGRPADDGHRAKCCVCGHEAAITTRLRTCSASVPGPRLAEAATARKVYDYVPGPGPTAAEQLMTDVARGVRVGEERVE